MTGAGDGGTVRILPLHRLPPGFLASLDNPRDPPVAPRPSATLVLLRSGGADLEVLLLKRSPKTGFIPGAWVFPGGTVDLEDGDPDLLPRIHGITPAQAYSRLEPVDSDPPALAYWVAALRETFEETGLLLHRVAEEQEPGSGEKTGTVAVARQTLLAGQKTFREVLETLDLSLDAGSLEYIGHWLTPECEPRRYETRFFVAEAPGDTSVTFNEKEMVGACWLSPAEALARNQDGGLPLVLPTLFTLEELNRFQTPQDALCGFRGELVPRRLPKIERVPGGIGFHLPD